jgi:DNA-binding transcriptional regulator YbjK
MSRILQAAISIIHAEGIAVFSHLMTTFLCPLATQLRRQMIDQPIKTVTREVITQL